ncbi:hypothetical protein BUALT_Bualt12G0037400 [Buddleja alternifolia]|uniref:NB-ARC domain-containing protein n=1 Tax=Buddleja alternifolia TaxID=168488 RepID=A0AAV6WZ29_9LAMI|nr:hypothetical protein BUALT_Bualt12G0037400 [Buddleja alternifolia]
MAAYAALVSVMHTIDQIQLHPSPPISLDQKQLMDNGDLFKDLEQVIKDMDIIKKEAMEIKLKKDDKLTRRYSMAQVGSSRLPSSARGNTMVGFDECLTEIMDKLTGQQSNRLIIPIVGMGGIGKTTLARNVYANPLIVEYFHICAWVTISQDYNVREILLEVLVSSNKYESRDNLKGKSEEELGENVYKSLCGRRYLIVMDDMWNIQAWDKLKFYLPNNNNGIFPHDLESQISDAAHAAEDLIESWIGFVVYEYNSCVIENCV